MSLPESCQLTGTHLVFFELVTDAQLGKADALYEHCCFVACTNGLRPAGPLEVAHAAIPALEEGTSILWGNRELSAEAAGAYEEQGYLLCELRLPVTEMGSPVPKLR